MNSCATVSPAKKAAINGLSIALVFLATGFVNIRLPIAANGGLIPVSYTHLDVYKRQV